MKERGESRIGQREELGYDHAWQHLGQPERALEHELLLREPAVGWVPPWERCDHGAGGPLKPRQSLVGQAVGDRLLTILATAAQQIFLKRGSEWCVAESITWVSIWRISQGSGTGWGHECVQSRNPECEEIRKKGRKTLLVDQKIYVRDTGPGPRPEHLTRKSCRSRKEFD